MNVTAKVGKSTELLISGFVGVPADQPLLCHKIYATYDILSQKNPVVHPLIFRMQISTTIKKTNNYDSAKIYQQARCQAA